MLSVAFRYYYTCERRIILETEEIPVIPGKQSKLTPKDDTSFDHLKLPKLPGGVKGGEVTYEVAKEWFGKFDLDDETQTKERKRRVTLYLYRLFPKIIREPSNIEVFPSLDEWSEDKVLAVHGGGEYQVRVNEVGSQGTILKFKFSIPMTTFPPILNWSEVSGTDKTNQTWLHNLISAGEIEIKGGKIFPVKKEDGKGVTMSDTVRIMEAQGKQFQEAFALAKELIPKTEKGDPELREMFKMFLESQKNQKPPENGLKEIMGLVTSLLPQVMDALKPRENKPDPMIIEMLKEARERTTQVEERFQKLLEKSLDKTSPDPIASINTTMELIERIKSSSGTEPAEPEKKTTIDRIIEAVGPALGIVMANAMGQPPQVPLAPSNSQQTANGTNIAPPATPAIASPSANQLEAILNLPLVRELITQKIKLGVEGHHFADELVQLYGTQMWAEISHYSPGDILSALNKVPLRQDLSAYDDKYLENWITKFVNYKELIEKEEMGENDE